MDMVVAKITNESLLCFPPPSPKQVSFHFGKPMRVIGTESKNSSPKPRQTGHWKEERVTMTMEPGGEEGGSKTESHCTWRGRRAIGPVL